MFTTIFVILEQFLFFSFVRNQEFKRQLTAKEELHYLNLYINEHDTKSRDILIEHNLRLVAHIAKKYESEKDLLEDLISIGTIGLIKAIDSYHIDKSTKLSTYASRCIENEILMHLRQHKKTSLDISLNEVLGFDKDGTEMTLMDIIPLQQRDIPDHVHISFQIRELQKYFYTLDKREKEIIIYRYGLNNTKEYTQKEIAKKLGISRSYVSRIEKRALIKLLKLFMSENEKNMS